MSIPMDIIENGPKLIRIKSQFHACDVQWISSTDKWTLWKDNILIGYREIKEEAINEAFLICSKE